MRETAKRQPEFYTVCAYMRLSIEDNDVFGMKTESGSITSQRCLIMEFINRQPEFAGCNVIERCDDGLSGKQFDNRPQFMDMIDMAKKGKINCIIVKDCSRFGRDYVELGDYLEQLFPFLGVRFISVNDNYDSARDEGGLDIAFKNLVYDVYSRELSKKQRQTWRRMAEQGKYWATQASYGYRTKAGDKHSLEPDPETAPIVREIFDMRLSGMGCRDIARNLNDRGIPCPSVHRHNRGECCNRKDGFEYMCWDGRSIHVMLQNEVYTGTVAMLKRTTDFRSGKYTSNPKEEWVRHENMHEAIVTKEEFMKIQQMTRPLKITAEKQRLHYRCGICGKLLPRRKCGTLYCNRGYLLKECECSGVTMNEQDADAVVFGELKQKMKRVLDEEELKIKRNGNAVSDTCYEVPNLKNALEAAKKAKQKLFEKLADREIDRAEFLERKKEYDAEMADLEQRLSDRELAERLSRNGEAESRERMETAKSFLDIDEMTDDIWDRFVDGAWIYPDMRIEVHWKFGEE